MLVLLGIPLGKCEEARAIMKRLVAVAVAGSFLWIMAAPAFAEDPGCAEILADSSGKYTKEQVEKCKKESNQ